MDDRIGGINYLHAKFQINILRNKKVINHLELWTLKKENSKYNRFVITSKNTTVVENN